MATKNEQASVSRFQPASMNPDDFSSGRPDAFIGTIIGTYGYPHRSFNKTEGAYYLNIGWLIKPDDDSGFDTFFETYSGGYLNAGVPSKDGKTPAGNSDEEYISLSAGRGELDTPCTDQTGMIIPDHDNVGEYILGSLAKKRSWEQAVETLVDSDTKKLVDFSTPGYLGFANGLRCRFDRVPQKGEDDKKTKKEGERTYTVLVPTSILERVSTANAKKAGVSTPPSSGKSANGAESSSTSSSEGDLVAEIKSAILEVLNEKGPQKRGTLMSLVPKKFDKGQKGTVMAWLGEDENLGDIEGTVYDMDSKELSLG